MKAMIMISALVALAACATPDGSNSYQDSSISPQRLHWPNTVVQHYDSKGKAAGYSVVPTVRSKR